MSTRRIDSIWLIGGIALMAVLIVASWFILIQPKYAEADGEREQAGTVIAQVSSLKSRYSQQKERAENLDQYMAELAAYQAALPQASNTNEIPAFLRSLQSLGTTLKVDVSAYTAAGPETVTGTGAVTALPINLDASGTPANLSKFLTQLQNTQPRALLIKSAVMREERAGEASVSLSMTAFITSSETVDLDQLRKDLAADPADS